MLVITGVQDEEEEAIVTVLYGINNKRGFLDVHLEPSMVYTIFPALFGRHIIAEGV